MTMRYDLVASVGDKLKDSGRMNPTDRDISLCVVEDADIAELWYQRYGKSLPHSIDSRQRTMLFNDIQKYINGQNVRGDGHGRGHRSSTSSSKSREVVFRI